MRKYSDKKNAQLQNYYKDRFYHAPHTQKLDVNESAFKQDYEVLKTEVDIINSFIELDFWVIEIKKEDNVKTLQMLHTLGYLNFTEASAIDFVADKNGFEVFYQLLNLEKRLRVRVRTFVGVKERLQSVAHVFKGANWSEREIYDMFGIFIINHPNLKRILMPDDWYGHPLLKTYPLQGDEFAQWYEIDKIFGKEYREVVGVEQRDPGFADDKDTLNFIQSKILDYFGVSLPVFNNSYNENEFNAFYETTVEPLAIQLSEAFSLGLLSDNELKNGAEIIFYSERLQYASWTTKVSAIEKLMSLGLMSINECRGLLGLEPIEGGNKRLQSLNFVDSDKANKYQIGEEEKEGNLDDKGNKNSGFKPNK